MVASNTPVRISVPLTDAPGRSAVTYVCGMRKGDNRSEFIARTDTRCRARTGGRAGVLHRLGQGIGKGVHSDTGSEKTGPAGQHGVGRLGHDCRDYGSRRAAGGGGIEKITVDSTPDYWRIWFYLFESAGLTVQLVNARNVKHVPGRPKTDKFDAVWLAKLTEKGLMRPSFVPPQPIRQLNDYTRLRIALTRERTRYPVSVCEHGKQGRGAGNEPQM